MLSADFACADFGAHGDSDNVSNLGTHPCPFRFTHNRTHRANDRTVFCAHVCAHRANRRSIKCTHCRAHSADCANINGTSAPHTANSGSRGRANHAGADSSRNQSCGD